MTSRVKQVAAHRPRPRWRTAERVPRQARCERGGYVAADVAGAIYFAESTYPPYFEPSMEATAAYDPPALITSNGAHAVIVKVDGETGPLHVVEIYVAEDARDHQSDDRRRPDHGGDRRGDRTGALRGGSTMMRRLSGSTMSFMDYRCPWRRNRTVRPQQPRHIETLLKLLRLERRPRRSCYGMAPRRDQNGVNDALVLLRHRPGADHAGTAARGDRLERWRPGQERRLDVRAIERDSETGVVARIAEDGERKLFGPDDQLGTLNTVTPTMRARRPRRPRCSTRG